MTTQMVFMILTFGGLAGSIGLATWALLLARPRYRRHSHRPESVSAGARLTRARGVV